MVDGVTQRGAGASGRTYVIATIKPWNVEAFHAFTPKMPGRWILVDRPEDLCLETIQAHQPRYVFFPHWSWKVAEEILAAAECVCFHMTDLPFGRGGSPLQNLIVRGHTETMLTALRMVTALDAGPVYLKRPLGLAGRAQDIYERAARLSYDMIQEMITTEPEPTPQSGEPTVFSRRAPDQSAMPTVGGLPRLYDHIRMLDAETYPRAFLDHGDFRLEFGSPTLGEDGVLRAMVEIRSNSD